ncbi:MAG: substrate-binding domain-containing protein [bacterium]|nr:substrate-binding domain-containing protein [bacterium]
MQDTALRLYVTSPVIPLANQLTNAYAPVDPAVTFEIITGNFETVYGRVRTDHTAYFLTNHLPPESLWAAPIGQDGIAVIVHPGNAVRALTLEQLHAVYRGQVVHWRDLGGAEREIAVFTRENGSGTRIEFERQVVGVGETTRSAQIVPSSAAMIDAVSRTPDGIGFVSMSYLDANVRAVAINGVRPTGDTVYDNTYPLRTFLYVAGYAEPHNPFRAFIFWIQSLEGQQIVGRSYAPLLRP